MDESQLTRILRFLLENFNVNNWSEVYKKLPKYFNVVPTN
jgi:hypothetical protein